jgi:hypothetical protein
MVSFAANNLRPASISVMFFFASRRAGGATGADQAAGMEQVQELVVTTILVHQVNSQGMIVNTLNGQKNRTAGGWEGPTTKLVT